MFKLLKVSLFLFGILFLLSCSSQKMKYGTKTEIHDKADSLESLARIKQIKSLDFSDFTPGKFDNGKVAVNYRFLKPKIIEKNKRYPLVLVFHGSGAIGTNNTSRLS